MDDTDRNILWDLRYEACDMTTECPSYCHFDECPSNPDYEGTTDAV
jgi:hypothetical protein